MRVQLLVIGLMLASFATPSRAGGDRWSIRLCFEQQPFMPITNTDPAFPGDGQILIDMAARQTVTTLVPVTASWRRCQQTLDSGEVDAIVGASYAAINIGIGEFPMRDGGADPNRSLGHLRTYLFRRSGAPVQLEQGRFVHLKSKVGIINAYQINALSVASFGGTVDDNSRTPESLAMRLVSGELDLVAGTRSLRRLCAGPHRGKIEQLARPLDDAHYYLAFGKAFYVEHRTQVEAFWNAMGQIKQSPDYLERLKHERRRRDAVAGSADCPVAH